MAKPSNSTNPNVVYKHCTDEYDTHVKYYQKEAVDIPNAAATFSTTSSKDKAAGQRTFS